MLARVTLDVGIRMYLLLCIHAALYDFCILSYSRSLYVIDLFIAMCRALSLVSALKGFGDSTIRP